MIIVPLSGHHQHPSPVHARPRFKGTSECGLYGDFVHELDWMVGEVVKTLEEQGVADNTLIIFTSDNGGMYQCGPGRMPGMPGTASMASCWASGSR